MKTIIPKINRGKAWQISKSIIECRVSIVSVFVLTGCTTLEKSYLLPKHQYPKINRKNGAHLRIPRAVLFNLLSYMGGCL